MDQSHFVFYLDQPLNCQIHDEWKEQIIPRHSWILDATVIHLATYWHFESLVHFLELNPGLRNKQTKWYQASPLHVAASIEDESVATTFLISKGADIHAKNMKGQTALHFAAQCSSVSNVIALVLEGNAQVVVKDEAGQTPLHMAKSSNILDILLLKSNPVELTHLTGKEGDLIL